MYRFLNAIQETIIAAIVVVPVLLLIGKSKQLSIFCSLLYIIFALYLCGVYSVVGLPNIGYYRFYPNCNWEPFLYMFSDLETTLLNVILFLPMGLLLPILWPRFLSFFPVVALGFSASLFIEFAQLFTYRATDINDLMTNTVGTIIGYLLARILHRMIPHLRTDKNGLRFVPFVTLPLLIMFVLQPVIWKIAN